MDVIKSIMSPIKKKWHFHGKVQKGKTQVYIDNIQFIVNVVFEKKLMTIIKFTKNFILIKTPFYFDLYNYKNFREKNIKMKKKDLVQMFFYVLYNKQKGICILYNKT